MTGEFLNQFKQNEDVELVSEGLPEASAAEDASSVPEVSAAEDASSVPEASAAEDPSSVPEASPAKDPRMPWKKRKASNSYRRKFLTIALVSVLIICGTLYSAILAIPNGPALVLSQVGIVIGNRWLILKAYEIGWQNSPYSVSNLVTWANERAAYNKGDAIQLYNDCLALNPNYPYTYLNRGATYYYLGEYDKAMADYNKAIDLNPHYALAFDNRASLWMAYDQLDKALVDESQAIAKRPDYHAYYFNRGRINRKLKRYDEALKDFTKAKDLGENYHRVQHEIDAIRPLLN